MFRIFSPERWAWIAVAAAALAWASAPLEAAGLMVARGPEGGVLKIKNHDVDVTINNGVAVTTVDQTFVNQEDRTVEALYTFPVPKDASVADFSMWVDGKEMVGEVIEKERAREIYNSYKRRNRDPGLLEKTDYKRFEMRVFPIAAHAERRVRVTYYQEVDVDHDRATYVYPLATVAPRDIDETTTGELSFSLDVKSEVPIAGMASPSHGDAIAVAEHNKHYFQASMERAEGKLGRDIVVRYELARPQTGFDMIASRQEGKDGYFLLTLTAGEDLERRDKGMDYLFVLDISGSMAHEKKLSLSRRAVAAFVKTLGKKDRFNLITFNVEAETLWGEMRPVTPESTKRAKKFLESKKARGSTVLRPAIEVAYQYVQSDRPLNVVILSDGMTERKNRRKLVRLARNRPEGTRIFAVGIGNEVNRPLLRQMAKKAGGLSTFVSRGSDFERQAKAFRRKLTRPAVHDVAIRFDGGQVYDVEPQEPRNLYHGSPLRFYGRYKKAGPTKVTVTGKSQGQQFERSVEVELPETEDANPEIERMWAWRRVQRLLARARKTGSAGEVRQRIVSLGERYSIATRFTSFIVLENNEEYRRWKIERRNLRRLERDRAAQKKLEEKLAELRKKAAAKVGPSPGPKESPANKEAKAEAENGVASQKPAAKRTQDETGDDSGSGRGRGRDLDVPSDGGGAGGGAFGPIGGALAVGLAGLWLVRRRNKR